jgi:pimeloyl-ACP methyl ester carboxylesterase
MQAAFGGIVVLTLRVGLPNSAERSRQSGKKTGELFGSPQKRQRRYRSDKNRNVNQWLPENGKIAQDLSLTENGVSEHWITTGGCRMRYLLAEGPQPPLLLIHGLLGYSFSWRYNLVALSRARKVIAVDLPGVGFSERVAGLDRSLPAMAERLLGFVRELKISALDVLGTSHGGGLATVLAAMARERSVEVNKLVLVAPVNPWSQHGSAITSFLATPAGTALYRGVSPFFRFTHRIALARMYGDPRRIKPGALEGYSAPLRIPGTTEHLLKIVQCWNSDLGEIESALPKIADVSTLLVWGDRDRAVLPSSAPILEAQFRNARLAIIKTAGHLPYEELPEEFNRVVSEFLGQ